MTSSPIKCSHRAERFAFQFHRYKKTYLQMQIYLNDDLISKNILIFVLKKKTHTHKNPKNIYLWWWHTFPKACFYHITIYTWAIVAVYFLRLTDVILSGFFKEICPQQNFNESYALRTPRPTQKKYQILNILQ